MRTDSPTLPLGARSHQSSALPLRAGADRAGLLQPRGGGGIGDVLGVDVARTARLRRHQPDHAVVGQQADRVDESVDEVTVVLAPPHHDDVDHVVVVLVDQLALDHLLDAGPQVEVGVVVEAPLLHGETGL